MLKRHSLYNKMFNLKWHLGRQDQQQLNFDEQHAQVDARQMRKSVDDIKISYQISQFMRWIRRNLLLRHSLNLWFYPETNVQPKPRV